MFDGTLIAIPPADALDERTLCEQCLAAVGGGATAIQLRMKNVSSREFMKRAETVIGCVDVPVYVNDRADIAISVGAAGVHLGGDDLPMDRARQIVRAPMKLGVSVGTTHEAQQAHLADADYWSFGPFFPTGTKPDAGSPIGSEGFRRLKTESRLGIPCVAIGGVTYERLDEVVGAGAAGVAVVSAIFEANDVEAATKRIRRRLDALLAP